MNTDLPPLVLRYKNHNGIVALRRVQPQGVWYGISPYHPADAGWYLRAYDLDRGAVRDFRMTDMLCQTCAAPPAEG